MKKARFIAAMIAALLGTACADDLVSTNTRAATEKWVSLRFATTQDVAAAVAPLATTQQVADVTAHISDTNLHLLAGDRAKIDGAITVEQDLAALRAYHYGSPDIVESPAEWFVFNGAGTITAFNWETGRTNVVIPWAIGGVQVTTIGVNAFYMSGIASVIAPQTVTSIGNYAFYNCSFLTSVTIPNSVTFIGEGGFSECSFLTSVTIPNSVTFIGGGGFFFCTSLTSLYFDGNAPTIEDGIFYGIADNQVTNYVTNPQATGWGAKLGDMPVVRLPLYGDRIYQAGELVATTGHVAQAIEDKVDVTSGTATNLTLAGWLQLPQAAATNLVLRLVCSNDHIIVQEVYQ